MDAAPDIELSSAQQYPLELHIAELVLHGFAAHDRSSIGAVLQEELVRLFDQQGIPENLNEGNQIIELDGGSFEVMQGMRAEAIGVHVAQAIYRGLNR